MKLLDDYKEYQDLFNKGYRFDIENETFFTTAELKKFVLPEEYEDWKVQKIDKDEYLNERLKELGISPEENKVDLFGKDNNRGLTAVFSANEYGDIEILQYSLKRKCHLYEVKTTTAGTVWEYCVQTRLNPLYASYCKGKYDFSEAQVVPFWHPSLIQHFEEKTELDYVVITEGQFKAWKGCKEGIPTIGLTSISHFRDQNIKELHPEIVEFLTVCKIKKVIILWDGDCTNISAESLKNEQDLYRRPYSFYNFAKQIRDELYKVFKKKQLDVFFVTIKELPGESVSPKGLDDLLTTEGLPTTAVKLDFDRIGDMLGYYIKWINISVESGIKELHGFFCLDSIYKFYQLHKEVIKNKRFIFKGNTYKIVDGHPVLELSKDLKAYKYIGNDYYRIVERPMPVSVKQGKTKFVLEEVLEGVKRETITRIHGKEACSKIETFLGFTNIPEHIDYQQVIHNYWNLYHNINHRKEPGDFPTIEKLLKHIFQEQFTMVLDYITILYRHPMQKLPILVLFSEEQGTGKSTFVYLLKLIFKNNMAVVASSELTSEFDSYWKSKLIVGCEEALFEGKKTYERLKDLNTQKMTTSNEKSVAQVQIPNMLHFVLCTNYRKFLTISKYDRRIWLREVQPFKRPQDDADVTFDQRLEEEIPHFIHYIENRDIEAPQIGEFWFHQRDFQTKAFFELVELSQPGVVKELKDVLGEWFMRYKKDTLEVTADNLIDYFKIKAPRDYLNTILRDQFGAERAKNRFGKDTVTTYSFEIPDPSDARENRTISGKGRFFILKKEMFLPDTEKEEQSKLNV